MEFSGWQWVASLLCGLLLVAAVTKGEDVKPSVMMKLYQASESDWTSTGREKYKEIVAAEATAYCGESTANCDGLQETYTISDYEEASITKVKAYLEVVYSMKNLGPSSYVNKIALKEITIRAAAKFKDQTDMTIVDVAGDQQPLAPKTTLNIAISVTAIAILIIMIIALLIMQHKCGGHDHELLAQKEEAVNNSHADDEAKKTARGTVTTLQSVVTDDQLPAKKDPPPSATLQTTDM